MDTSRSTPPYTEIRGRSPEVASRKSPPGTPSSAVVTVIRQPLIPSSPREAIELAEQENCEASKARRKLFAKTSDERRASKF